MTNNADQRMTHSKPASDVEHDPAFPEKLVRSEPLMDLKDYFMDRSHISEATGQPVAAFESPELSAFVRDAFTREAFSSRQDDTAISLWNDMYARTLNVFKHIVHEHLTIPNNGYLLGKSTALAQQVFKQYFGVAADMQDVCVVFTTTGTAANRTCTSPFLDHNSAIVATSKAHLIEREGRSSEAQTGSSVYVLDTGTEPLTAAELDAFLVQRKKFDPITQKPKIFSLTTPEEDGHVYSVESLKAIADVVHKHGMLFHIDGARLFHAAAAQNVSMRDLTTEVGADSVALGGSKIGLYMANASVFLPSFFSHGYEQRLHNFKDGTELFSHLRGALKRGGLLAGQSEAMASQFLVGLHDNLFIELGSIANQNAQFLGSALSEIPGCSLFQPVESNVAMVSLPKHAYENLLKHFDGVKIWHDSDPQNSENLVARFITSATMEKGVLQKVVYLIGEVVNAARVH